MEISGIGQSERKMLMKIGTRRRPASSQLLRIMFLLIIGAGARELMAQPISAQVEPAATNAAIGTSVTFCAVVQGSGTFTYQWQKNGLNLPGATNQCLSVTNIAIADGGSYRATITGGLNALQSEEGLLLVSLDSLPGTDLFDAGTFITVASNSVSGASFSATRWNSSHPRRGRVTLISLPTHADYMGGKVSFEDYYRSIWQKAGSPGGWTILFPRAKGEEGACGRDEHLNTIELSSWDAIATSWQERISESLKRHGDAWSLAGGVCTVKQAAIDQERQVMAEKYEAAQVRGRS